MEIENLHSGFLSCRRPPLNRCSEGMVEKLSNFEGYIVYKRQVTALKIFLKFSSQYPVSTNALKICKITLVMIFDEHFSGVWTNY